MEFDKAAAYTLARPLFYYYGEGSSSCYAADIKELLCWVLGTTGQNIVEEVGYVSLATAFPEVLATEKAALNC